MICSCFELLDHICKDKHGFALILCTSCSEYDIQAFRQEAIDYFLNAVDSNRLRNALEKTHRSVAGAWSTAVNSLQERLF